MRVLETDRLLLRHQEPGDLDALYALYCDPEITRHIPDAPRSYDEARRELEWHQHGHKHRPELGLWATIHKPSGTFIGRSGLLPWNIDGREEVEVAFLIAKPFWGQGLGSEAAQGIARYGFERLGLQRLICLIEPGNEASIRIARKLGMEFEREFVDAYGVSLIYSLENA